VIEIDIPGYENLHLEHVVLDYNGTMAVDGKLIPGVKERLLDLAKKLKVHVLTADTFGRVVKELSDVPCKVYILRSGHEDIGKMNYVKELSTCNCVVIGNGRNDAMMLKSAALGIAVIQEEGASIQAITAADIVTTSILFALDLLANPLRIKATLRL